jgi:hypothetical protein
VEPLGLTVLELNTYCHHCFFLRAVRGILTPYTLKLIRQNREELDDRTASHYYSKFGYTAPKYLRKFCFDTMLSEKLSIPESIADFVEGRTPRKIGAKHYTRLLAQPRKGADPWRARRESDPRYRRFN